MGYKFCFWQPPIQFTVIQISYIDKNPCWKATSSSASHEISHILGNPKSLVPYSQQSATCPSPQSDQSSSHPAIHYIRYILILYPYLCLGLQGGLFLSGLLSKTMYTFLFPPIYITCKSKLTLVALTTMSFTQPEDIPSMKHSKGV